MKKLLLLVLVSIILSACRFQSGTDGRQTGYIEAVQRTGYIWKNYRVFIKSSVDASQADVYCINQDKQELADSLFNAQEQNQRVTIQYTHWTNVIAPSQCAGDEINSFNIVETK